LLILIIITNLKIFFLEEEKGEPFATRQQTALLARYNKLGLAVVFALTSSILSQDRGTGKRDTGTKKMFAE
jgi:hypothetical protein